VVSAAPMMNSVTIQSIPAVRRETSPSGLRYYDATNKTLICIVTVRVVSCFWDKRVMLKHSEIGKDLPDDIWSALIRIHAYVDTLRIDPISKKVLTAGIENLAIRLAEAPKHEQKIKR
jgi:hypothetical protein